MKKTLILCVIILIGTQFSRAQIGGQNTYAFLNLENSARIAALGGETISVIDDDISLSISNPSLITNELNHDLAFSFVDYFSDINYGFVSYSRSFRNIGSFVGSVQFIDYGTFKYANEAGVQEGEFGASEFAVIIGWGRDLNKNFRIGANAKFIYSSLESYNSFGLAVDLAASYIASRTDFMASMVLSNIGRQLKSYRSGNLEPLPFKIVLALSNKLKHIPFRYTLILTHLEKWDISYSNLYNRNIVNNQTFTDENMPSIGEKLMSHLVLGGELSLTDNFVLRAGYNYRRRQEMKVESKFSTVGFSWGFGIKIDKFQLNYARSNYHLVGSPNYLTLILNLADF